MFSRFFKPKFYKKSKSSLDSIKLRIDIIQRKRNAVHKFFKNDIAEFLRLGLDYNAYQRAARLLMEDNKSLCYNLIEKYSGCVLNHLDDLSKQRECPDECKEAVQALIYAAARFGDLPELRKLRSLFTQKYGNYFEPYLSQEFVRKLRQDLPTRETTIQLLHDIAGEFSLQWDSNSLIQQIFRPPLLCGQRNQDEEIEMSNKGEGKKDVISIYESGNEEEEPRSSTEIWSQDSKKASSSSSFPSVSEDDDDKETKNNRPFSSSHVPAPYCLTPKKPNHRVEDNLQNEEKPKFEPKPRQKEISVRTIRSDHSARHVHPKLLEFDDLTTQFSSIRRPQDCKKASSSSSFPSVFEDGDDEETENNRPFSSSRVPAPYRLTPKKPNNRVEGNLQNEENPKLEPKPRQKEISVRTIRSDHSVRHVHPKLPEFDDLATQLSSIRRPQDSKQASSSSSFPSVFKDDDDEETENNRPFSSGRVPAPYRLTPKKHNHRVEGNLQNEEKPKLEPKPRQKEISVRTIRFDNSVRHVHPKLPEFNDLATQLSSIRQPQDSKQASSSSSFPSVFKDDDNEETENNRPFSSGRVLAPYRLTPKKPNHRVEGNLQNEEKPKLEPKPRQKGISVRTIKSDHSVRHVHPKLSEFDDLATQLSSIRHL